MSHDKLFRFSAGFFTASGSADVSDRARRIEAMRHLRPIRQKPRRVLIGPPTPPQR